MEPVNAVVGIIQLVIAIILAVVALYIGFSVLGKITKGIDEEKEIAKGNTAVGILVASVFIAIGIVVQSGVSGISETPDWTTIPIAMNTDATRIPTAVLPLAISFSSSIPLVIFPNTEKPIYNATTARIMAITNCIIPTTAFNISINSPHAFSAMLYWRKGNI